MLQYYLMLSDHQNIMKVYGRNAFFIDPNLPGEDGATPIHYAARYRPLSDLKHLSSTLSTNDVNAEPPSEK